MSEFQELLDRAATIADAIAVEREACARVAESISTDWWPSEESADAAIRHGKKIAADIRARRP